MMIELTLIILMIVVIIIMIMILLRLEMRAAVEAVVAGAGEEGVAAPPRPAAQINI